MIYRFGIMSTYKAGDQVVMICRHHSDLLSLFEDGLNLLRGTIQDDVNLAGFLHVFQKGPKKENQTHAWNKTFNAINFYIFKLLSSSYTIYLVY